MVDAVEILKCGETLHNLGVLVCSSEDFSVKAVRDWRSVKSFLHSARDWHQLPHYDPLPPYDQVFLDQ